MKYFTITNLNLLSFTEFIKHKFLNFLVLFSFFNGICKTKVQIQNFEIWTIRFTIKSQGFLAKLPSPTLKFIITSSMKFSFKKKKSFVVN